jgi:hypothetical protein
MRLPTQRNVPLFAWALTTTVLALAFFAWGQSYHWQLGSLSVYQIFPLFGLIALSTMWAQYMAGALQQWQQLDGKLLQRYYAITGFIVLVAILIHPGLLSWQLWHDGFGLPPGSELHFVGAGLRVAVVIGMTALLIFLAYELRRRFAGRRWWRFMDILVDLAVIGVFYHSLTLGMQTRHGWFRAVWILYGISFILAVTYKYAAKALSYKNHRIRQIK